MLAGLGAGADGLGTGGGVVEGVFSTSKLGGGKGERSSSGTLREREVSLIKVSSLSNHCLLRSGIVELPALISLRVANEYTFLHV